MYIVEDNIPLDKLGEREDYYIDLMGYYNIAEGRKAFTPTALRNMSDSHLGKINANRKLKTKEVLYILSLNNFLDGVERTVASLSNGRYSREVPKSIINGRTYTEISKFYNTLSFDKRLLLFSKALNFYTYDPWKNTNSSCPKKNCYMNYIIQHTLGWPRQEVADILHMSKGGVRKFALEVRRNERELNADFSETQIKKILMIILDKQYRAKLLKEEGVETMRKQ